MSRERHPFHLVQRLSRDPYAAWAEKAPMAKVLSNPFGSGRLGDYTLDYMGAAEFEFGAIPEANNRLAAAKDDLAVAEFEYRDQTFDFLWITSEGEPFKEWTDWAEGRSTDPYSGHVYDVRPFDGKERPYELEMRLKGEEPFDSERGWRTALWWALRANVIFGFKEDGHLQRWLESMATSPSEFLR